MTLHETLDKLGFYWYKEVEPKIKSYRLSEQELLEKTEYVLNQFYPKKEKELPTMENMINFLIKKKYHAKDEFIKKWGEEKFWDIARIGYCNSRGTPLQKAYDYKRLFID